MPMMPGKRLPYVFEELGRMMQRGKGGRIARTAFRMGDRLHRMPGKFQHVGSMATMRYRHPKTGRMLTGSAYRNLRQQAMHRRTGLGAGVMGGGALGMALASRRNRYRGSPYGSSGGAGM